MQRLGTLYLQRYETLSLTRSSASKVCLIALLSCKSIQGNNKPQTQSVSVTQSWCRIHANTINCNILLQHPILVSIYIAASYCKMSILRAYREDENGNNGMSAVKSLAIPWQNSCFNVWINHIISQIPFFGRSSFITREFNTIYEPTKLSVKTCTAYHSSIGICIAA